MRIYCDWNILRGNEPNENVSKMKPPLLGHGLLNLCLIFTCPDRLSFPCVFHALWNIVDDNKNKSKKQINFGPFFGVMFCLEIGPADNHKPFYCQ